MKIITLYFCGLLLSFSVVAQKEDMISKSLRIQLNEALEKTGYVESNEELLFFSFSFSGKGGLTQALLLHWNSANSFDTVTLKNSEYAMYNNDLNRLRGLRRQDKTAILLIPILTRRLKEDELNKGIVYSETAIKKWAAAVKLISIKLSNFIMLDVSLPVTMPQEL